MNQLIKKENCVGLNARLPHSVKPIKESVLLLTHPTSQDGVKKMEKGMLS